MHACAPSSSHSQLEKQQPKQEKSQPQQQREKSPTKRKSSPSQHFKIWHAAELTSKLSWSIPPEQHLGDDLPPQPGVLVHGQVVKGSKHSDTNWSAFSLIIYINSLNSYQVLTQMRAHGMQSGTIETMGGHLLGGQTWRQGAQDELKQEAGITLDEHAFHLLNYTGLKISQGHRLYGNTNFFVAISKSKPSTSNSCSEINPSYGHQWLDLATVYREVLEENYQLGRSRPGKYYSFFRQQVIAFCQRVLDWQG